MIARQQFLRMSALLLVTVLFAGSTGAQEFGFESPAVGVFNAVVHYRLTWLGDSTRIAACKAYEALGKPADFPAAIPKVYREILVNETATCTLGSPMKGGGGFGVMSTVLQQGDPLVIVNSMSVNDSTADVELTVRRGEHQHRQQFFLRRGQLGNRRLWAVTRIVASDFVQSHGSSGSGSVPRVPPRSF